VVFKPAGFIGFHTVTDNSGSAGGTNHRDGVEAGAGSKQYQELTPFRVVNNIKN